jgi:hypothetical protein
MTEPMTIPAETMERARNLAELLDALMDRYHERADAPEVAAMIGRYEGLQRKMSFTEAWLIARSEFLASALSEAEQRGHQNGMRDAAECLDEIYLFRFLKANKIRKRGEIAKAATRFMRSAILPEEGAE